MQLMTIFTLAFALLVVAVPTQPKIEFEYEDETLPGESLYVEESPSL